MGKLSVWNGTAWEELEGRVPQALTDAVNRIDPGASAPLIGASLAQGPTGPQWRKDAVSADWFSDLNNAVIAAQGGGTVLLSRDTTYTTGGSGDALRLVDGVTIQGEDRFTSVISGEGAAIVQTATPNTQVQNAYMHNLTLDGGGVALLGLDARELTRCHFDLLRIQNVTGHATYFGGDIGVGGWSNTLWRSLIHASVNGAAIHIAGRVGGGTGAATGNNINVQGCAIYAKDGDESYAIQIFEGENNQFIGNDMGYGAATAIRLVGQYSQQNHFVANRTENTTRGVVIEGGQYNVFIANHFHARSTSSPYHVIENINGAYRNAYIMNSYTQGGTVWPIFYD